MVTFTVSPSISQTPVCSALAVEVVTAVPSGFSVRTSSMPSMAGFRVMTEV